MQCACAMLSSVACPALQIVSTLSHKKHVFRKKVIERKYILIFSTTLPEIFLFKKTERYMIKNYIAQHVNYSLFLSYFNET